VKHLDDAHDQVDLVIATALRERKPVRQSKMHTVSLPATASRKKCESGRQVTALL